MGTIVQAACDCGYRSKALRFGAGMTDFDRILEVPVLRHGENEICTLNILREKNVNGCHFYSFTASEAEDNRRTHDFFDERLPAKGNFCPKCGKNSLRFDAVGLFD